MRIDNTPLAMNPFENVAAGIPAIRQMKQKHFVSADNFDVIDSFVGPHALALLCCQCGTDIGL
jgi:hypothetical protein